MILIPRAKTVIGELVEYGESSNILWTPNNDKKQTTLLQVKHVGPEVTEVKPGDVAVLHPDWQGSKLQITDDEDEDVSEQYLVVPEEYLLMLVRDA